MGRHNLIQPRHRKPNRLIAEAVAVLVLAVAALGLVWVSEMSREEMRRDPDVLIAPMVPPPMPAELPRASARVAPKVTAPHATRETALPRCSS